MKIKLKPWDEVVKLAINHYSREYVYGVNGIEYVFGLCEDDLPWGNYVISKPADSGDYFVDETAWVHDWMVDKNKPTSDDILRSGKVITDDQMHTINVDVDRRPVTGGVRIRLIAYEGNLYFHKTVNGDIVDCHSVGKADA